MWMPGALVVAMLAGCLAAACRHVGEVGLVLTRRAGVLRLQITDSSTFDDFCGDQVEVEEEGQEWEGRVVWPVGRSRREATLGPDICRERRFRLVVRTFPMTEVVGEWLTYSPPAFITDTGGPAVTLDSFWQDLVHIQWWKGFLISKEFAPCIYYVEILSGGGELLHVDMQPSTMEEVTVLVDLCTVSTLQVRYSMADRTWGSWGTSRTSRTLQVGQRQEAPSSVGISYSNGTILLSSSSPLDCFTGDVFLKQGQGVGQDWVVARLLNLTLGRPAGGWNLEVALPTSNLSWRSAQEVCGELEVELWLHRTPSHAPLHSYYSGAISLECPTTLAAPLLPLLLVVLAASTLAALAALVRGNRRRLDRRMDNILADKT